MTSEGIKKARDICQSGGACCGCPYEDRNELCLYLIQDDAFRTIKSQEQEIEQLRKAKDFIIETIKSTMESIRSVENISQETAVAYMYNCLTVILKICEFKVETE